MPISFEDSNRIDDYWSLRKNAAMYPTGELPIEIKGQIQKDYVTIYLLRT